MIRQEEKAPKEVGSGKTAIPTDEVPIAKIERNETNFSSTTEGSKERLGKSNGKEEKKTFQDLVQSLERVLSIQNEYTTTLKEEQFSNPEAKTGSRK